MTCLNFKTLVLASLTKQGQGYIHRYPGGDYFISQDEKSKDSLDDSSNKSNNKPDLGCN